MCGWVDVWIATVDNDLGRFDTVKYIKYKFVFWYFMYLTKT